MLEHIAICNSKKFLFLRVTVDDNEAANGTPSEDTPSADTPPKDDPSNNTPNGPPHGPPFPMPPHSNFSTVLYENEMSYLGKLHNSL